MRLEEVLRNHYYAGHTRRLPGNIDRMSWFITQDLGIIRKKSYVSWLDGYRHDVTFYNTQGFDKRVEPIDLEGETFFVCPCEEFSKNGELLKSQGWKVIDDRYLDMECKERR